MTVSNPEIRILAAGDEPLLERYLAARPDTTLFFQSNLRAVGGLGADPMAPFGGVYAASFEGAHVTGVVAHYWNGSAILEADVALAALVRTAVRGSGHALKGLLGPAVQVRAARSGLGLDDAPTTMTSVERLYSLDTAELRVPAALAAGSVRCRRANDADAAHLLEWRMAYMVEAIGETDTEQAREQARDSIARGIAGGRAFLLEADGRPVSMSGFNAWVPACAQIGGVYTPPELRSRGYGRAVVAGSLQIAAAEGTRRSVLFTDDENVPAQRSYEALGYEVIGDYALTFFRDPQDIP